MINAYNPIPLSPHSLSIFKTRATEGPSSYLLPVPRGSLQEGGTQAAVGLGREIKHLNSSSHSQLLGQMHQRGIAGKLKNPGWNHPSARQLLDCVGSLDRYQAEKAQEQGEHGAVLCQLHRKAEQLDRDKTLNYSPSNGKHFRRFSRFSPTAFVQQHSVSAAVAWTQISHINFLQVGTTAISPEDPLHTRSRLFPSFHMSLPSFHEKGDVPIYLFCST